MQLASFLNSWPNSLETIRVKTKFCSLCHALFAKPDILTIKKSAIVRNSLLETIHQWVSVMPVSLKVTWPAFILTFVQNEWAANEQDILTKKRMELDFGCVQTAATILDRLRLQPLDGSTGSELGLAISRLFTKYLNFFVGALEKAVAVEVIVDFIIPRLWIERIPGLSKRIWFTA